MVLEAAFRRTPLEQVSRTFESALHANCIEVPTSLVPKGILCRSQLQIYKYPKLVLRNPLCDEVKYLLPRPPPKYPSAVHAFSAGPRVLRTPPSCPLFGVCPFSASFCFTQLIPAPAVGWNTGTIRRGRTSHRLKHEGRGAVQQYRKKCCISTPVSVPRAPIYSFREIHGCHFTSEHFGCSSFYL